MGKKRFGFLLLAGVIMFSGSAGLSAQMLPTPETPAERNPASTPAEEPSDPVSFRGLPDVPPENRLQIAVSSPDYPVTPGDLYMLSFRSANEVVTSQIMADGDYSVNLNLFGKVNAAGMTFMQLKERVEQVVSRAYPGSLPTLSLVSVGLFRVVIKGEVPQTGYVSAWGLSRLSNVIYGRLGDYSSIRNVTIVSREGKSRTCDLFQALRFGAENEDPYVRLGDEVIIGKRDRIVTISGEVYHPGKYELQEEEGMQELELFSGGFTGLADLSRIKLERKLDTGSEILYLTSSGSFDLDVDLRDNDWIFVPSRGIRRPVIFFEGAVTPLNVPDRQEDLQARERGGPVPYNRFAYRFIRGVTLYDILLDVEPRFSAEADLSSAYLIREGQPNPIELNLEEIYYTSVPERDFQMEPFDRIIVPARWYSVMVQGAVPDPGTYSYVPDQDARYYINRAGGFDRERNTNASFTLFDGEGNRKDDGAVLYPGDRVLVHANGFIYNFNRYFPIAVTTAAFILTIAEVIDLVTNGSNN